MMQEQEEPKALSQQTPEEALAPLITIARLRLGDEESNYTDAEIIAALGEAMIATGYRPEGVNRETARRVGYGSKSRP